MATRRTGLVAARWIAGEYGSPVAPHWRAGTDGVQRDADGRGAGAGPRSGARVLPGAAFATPPPGAPVTRAWRHDVGEDDLGAFLRRHDPELQERTLVVAHVHAVDAREVFLTTRAQFWLRCDELIGLGEDDRRVVLRLLLARRARELARHGGPEHGRGRDGVVRTPAEEAALAAVSAHAPDWRGVDPAVALAAPETTAFRAMAHLTGTARDVLVLCWLSVAFDDIADELRVSSRTLTDLIGEARTQIRALLAAAERRS